MTAAAADPQPPAGPRAGGLNSSVPLRGSVIPAGRSPAIPRRKAGPLAWLTQGQPTNYNMVRPCTAGLALRDLTRVISPNHN